MCVRKAKQRNSLNNFHSQADVQPLSGKQVSCNVFFWEGTYDYSELLPLSFHLSSVLLFSMTIYCISQMGYAFGHLGLGILSPPSFLLNRKLLEWNIPCLNFALFCNNLKHQCFHHYFH